MSVIKRNKEYVFVCLFIVIVILIQLFMNTNAGYVIPRYLGDESYRLMLEEEGRTAMEILWGNFQREPIGNQIIFSTTLFQIIITFIAGLGGLQFCLKFRSIEKMKYYRYHSMRRAFYLDCLRYSLKWAAAIFAGYLIIYALLCVCTSVPDTDYSQIPRTLFLDILGQDFYFDHHRLYWFMEGCVRFLWIPFTYAFFTCALSITAYNSKIVYLIPNLYYIILTAFCATVLNGLLGLSWLANILNPSVVMASSTYEISTPMLLLPTLIPVIISVCLIERYMEKDVL